MYEPELTKGKAEHCSIRPRSQSSFRLFLAIALTAAFLSGSIWLSASAWAIAMREEPTWHDFLPQGEITDPPVVMSVDLTTDVPPIQNTGVYSISFDRGATWIKLIPLRGISELGENEWRLETSMVSFPNSEDIRVHFAVRLEGQSDNIVSPFYQVKVSRKRFVPLFPRNYPATWARYEPNDTFDTAYGPLESGRTYEAYIWPAEDQDYYYIDATSTTADITVSLTNLPADVDYDLYLYDNALTLVGQSAHYGNVDESIRYRPTTTGRYYVRVYPYQGAHQDKSYRLHTVFP